MAPAFATLRRGSLRADDWLADRNARQGARLERVKGIEPSSSAWKAVALPLSYTRLQKSEDRMQVSEQLPSISDPCCRPSVLRMVGEVGLEPTKAQPADLQSAPFAARDTPPFDCQLVAPRSSNLAALALGNAKNRRPDMSARRQSGIAPEEDCGRRILVN